MGSEISTQLANERSFGIFTPPKPCTYDHKDVKFIKTVDHDDICLKLIVPWEPLTDTWDAYHSKHPLIIFCHGNADDIGTCASYAQWMADSVKVNVLIWDYVNYGLSTSGLTTEDNMLRGAEAVYGFAQCSLKASQIIPMGKSLGSISAIHIASAYKKDISGLILVSPLASGLRVMMNADYLPLRMQNFFDQMFAPSIERIGNVKCKIFLIHGTNDKVVPIRNSYDISSRMNRESSYPPLWVHAGHNDIEAIHAGIFISSLNTFVDGCTQRDYMDFMSHIDSESNINTKHKRASSVDLLDFM